MTQTFRIERVHTDLPPDIASLHVAAASEGVRNVGTLIEDWNSGKATFDQEGEALFGAFGDGALVGVGGVTRDPERQGALRVRRFYVHQDWRRRGVARALAGAAMTHARAHTDTLTCNARASAAAAPFWEAMGFSPVEARDVTHILRRG